MQRKKPNYVEAIRELLRRKPFQRFTIRLSDGRALDVDHPEFVFALPEAQLVMYVTDDYRPMMLNPAQIVSADVSNQPRKRSA